MKTVIQYDENNKIVMNPKDGEYPTADLAEITYKNESGNWISETGVVIGSLYKSDTLIHKSYYGLTGITVETPKKAWWGCRDGRLFVQSEESFMEELETGKARRKFFTNLKCGCSTCRHRYHS